ncbi:MAG: hypothetical protein ACK4I0_02350 [Brevundimonas sp.]|uniref:hypothetical protein n=1 Tax=Brevundimonas sp. TaxID=1871086 RepID=UPI00391C80E2
MTSFDLKPWLQAAHPLREPRGMLEGQRSARLGAVALMTHAAAGVALIGWMGVNPQAAMTLATPELENMAGGTVALELVMPVAAVFAAIFTLLVYGLIAALQWTKMTRFIPMAALILTGWGAFMNVAAIVTGGMAEVAPSPVPVWLVAVDWVATAILVVLSGAALKGAVYLRRLKAAR